MNYPLHWPIQQKRTPPHRRRQHPSFSRSLTIGRAVDDVLEEIRRLHGNVPVISTNLRPRNDGLPHANQRRPDDPGVAVYFVRKTANLVFACDLWDRPEHNLRAIAKHLDALRGMERWGVGTLDQAFTGYQALPDSTFLPWWLVLGMEQRPKTTDELQRAYREKAKATHPDAGGTADDFRTVLRAYEQGCEELQREFDALCDDFTRGLNQSHDDGSAQGATP